MTEELAQTRKSTCPRLNVVKVYILQNVLLRLDGCHGFFGTHLLPFTRDDLEPGNLTVYLIFGTPHFLLLRTHSIH